MGLVHDGMQRMGLWTASLVHDGPRPSLPLLSLAQVNWVYAGLGGGTTAPSPLTVALSPEASSRASALWWLSGVAEGVYGAVGSWGTQRWAKGGGLGLQAVDVGIVAARDGAGQ